MKIIDLLNKIANGKEVPKGIRYKCENWFYDEKNQDYINNDSSTFLLSDLFTDDIITCFINDEVEIIEDKPKIDNILIQKNREVTGMKDSFVEGMLNHFYDMDLEVREKMNEIIKVVNELIEKDDE